LIASNVIDFEEKTQAAEAAAWVLFVVIAIVPQSDVM